MNRLPSFSLILCIGLALRCLWALLIPVDPTSDSISYDTLAQNILQHGVYGFTPEELTAYWAVGAAAVYAAAYGIFGIGALAVVAVNMLSSALAIWGLWDLGRRWFGETEGRIAALLFAFWPMAIQFTTVLASELHFIAATLLGLMAWDRARRVATAGFWLWSLAAGLVLAGGTYLRPIALLIPAALALAVLLRAPRSSPAAILKAGVITAIIFACVSPWSARNERVLGAPVFMSTNFWVNFWMGNHPGTNGEYVPLPDAVAGMNEIERDAYMRELALGYLREDPTGFVTRTIWKAMRLHQRETIGVGWNEPGVRALTGDAGVTGLKLVSTGWWYAVLTAGLAGAGVLVRRRGASAALLSEPVWLWLYFTAIHAIIVVGDRYHMPAIPMIALLAGVSVGAVLRPRTTDQG